MKVTTKGQVTIPLEIRKALGITPGTEVTFAIDGDGVRLLLGREWAETQVERMVGAGDGTMTTEEILALTRG